MSIPDDTHIENSSGNVFADLGRPEAETQASRGGQLAGKPSARPRHGSAGKPTGKAWTGEMSGEGSRFRP